MFLSFKTVPNKSVDAAGVKLRYRELGQIGSGIPLIFLHHLTAVLDDWDPAVVDGLAARHHVILFDNRGVGGSKGKAPNSVDEMAQDAIAFIEALGFANVDLLGFSLGGFIAQTIARQRPSLVRRIILAGTGPAGGAGISNVGAVFQEALAKAQVSNKHPKQFLFFTQTDNGQAAATAFLARLNERVTDRDDAASMETIQSQIQAIQAWGEANPAFLSDIQQPTLVANGDHDVMTPTIGSFELSDRLPNAELSIFPDAGHGGIFQYADLFVAQATTFLTK